MWGDRRRSRRARADSDRRGVCACLADASAFVRNSRKPPFHRHFLHFEPVPLANSHRREYLRGTCASGKRTSSKNDAGDGAYTQNSAESLLFFSRCSNRIVVRIDSRLHCTDIAIHTQARRAAMAKKRKAKKAAAKKTTKRRKKK